MLSVISNIDYNILYFFKLLSKLIISLLFGELSNTVSIISLLFSVSIPNPGYKLQVKNLFSGIGLYMWPVSF